MTEDREGSAESQAGQSDEGEGRFGYRPPPEQDRPEKPDVIEGYDPPPKPPEPMTEPERDPGTSEPDDAEE